MSRIFCRHPKHKPYGAKGTEPYCGPHDCCTVYNVSKRSIRNQAKKEIEKERKRIGK